MERAWFGYPRRDLANDPDPILLPDGEIQDWKMIKQFFEDNIKQFEKALIMI